jgi:hypothetical protein|uniref:Uncharacterized protein n=1 Tax=Fagus sylvatica TaxID=28930 RepID=A0A2N9J714_FAGSY
MATWPNRSAICMARPWLAESICDGCSSEVLLEGSSLIDGDGRKVGHGDGVLGSSIALPAPSAPIQSRSFEP